MHFTIRVKLRIFTSIVEIPDNENVRNNDKYRMLF